MLDPLSPLQLGYCVAVLFGAYFIRGIAGFGSALVAVPLLVLVLPVTAVVPTIMLLDYVASLSHGLRHRRRVQWRELLPLLPFTATGILLALYVLHTVAPGVLTVALGLFVIAYGVYSLLPLPPLRGGKGWALPLGLLAGTVGGLFGTGGPFTVIYLTLRGLDRLAFRGTIAVIFVIDGGLRLAGFAAAGLYGRERLLIALAALPVTVAGLYLGGHLHTGLGRTAFVRIVAAVLIGSGVALLAK